MDMENACGRLVRPLIYRWMGYNDEIKNDNKTKVKYEMMVPRIWSSPWLEIGDGHTCSGQLDMVVTMC